MELKRGVDNACGLPMLALAGAGVATRVPAAMTIRRGP